MKITYICSASDFASFWPEEDILEVQFDIIDDIRHGAVSVKDQMRLVSRFVLSILGAMYNC